MKAGALRAKQTELTRETILNALVERISKSGVHDLSVQPVADDAGVAHRTVYRHFPTREALLEGLEEWLDARFQAALDMKVKSGYPDIQADDLGRVSELCFQVFQENANLVAAYVILSIGARLRLRARVARSAWFERLLASHTKHLPAEDARAASAMVRMLASSVTWHHLREHTSAAPEAAGRAVRWAVDTLVADLAAGGGPRPAPSAPAEPGRTSKTPKKSK